MTKDAVDCLDQTMTFRYDGVFSVEDFYQLTIKRLEEYQYKIFETRYKKKKKGPNVENEINIKAEKKFSPYIRYDLKFVIKVEEALPIPIKHKGDKVYMKGKVQYKVVQADITTDYKNRWTGKFSSKIEVFFKKIILKRYLISGKYGGIQGFCYEFINQAKQAVNSASKKSGF